MRRVASSAGENQKAFPWGGEVDQNEAWCAVVAEKEATRKLLTLQGANHWKGGSEGENHSIYRKGKGF